MAATRVEWLFPVLAAGYGLAGAVLWPALFASVAGALPETERGKAAGLMALTTAVAGAFALIGGALLTDLAGGRASILVSAGTLAAASVLAGSSLRERRTPADRGREAIRPRLLLAFLRRRGTLAAVFVCQAAALGALTPAAARYGIDILGIEVHRVALLLTVPVVVALLTVNAGGFLADRLGRTPVMVVGFAAAAGGTLSMRVFAEPSYLPLTASLAAGGYALAVPALNASMMDAAGGARTGLMLGWFMIAEGAGQAVGPVLGGLLLENGGALRVLEASAILLSVCTLLATRAVAGQGKVRPVAGVGDTG